MIFLLLMILSQDITTYQARTACDSVAPLSFTINWHGSGKDITITDASGCKWAAMSTVGWLKVQEPASGIGTGIVSFIADPNNTSSQRVGYIRLTDFQNNWKIKVTQKSPVRKK